MQYLPAILVLVGHYILLIGHGVIVQQGKSMWLSAVFFTCIQFLFLVGLYYLFNSSSDKDST